MRKLAVSLLLVVSCGGSAAPVVQASPSSTQSVRFTPIAQSPTPTEAPLPTHTTPPGYATVTIQVVDAAGKAEKFTGLGPQIFLYPATPATCSYFRSGGGANTAQDTVVVGGGHTKIDGSIRLEVPSPGRYFILTSFQGWWKGEKSCETADVFTVSGDVSLDLQY